LRVVQKSEEILSLERLLNEEREKAKEVKEENIKSSTLQNQAEITSGKIEELNNLITKKDEKITELQKLLD
jgi:hypothetical protein